MAKVLKIEKDDFIDEIMGYVETKSQIRIVFPPDAVEKIKIAVGRGIQIAAIHKWFCDKYGIKISRSQFSARIRDGNL